MPIITKKYHKEKIKELNSLITKAHYLKHKSIWHLYKWRNEHFEALRERDK